MKQIFASLCLLLCAVGVMAVPARRVKKTITLSDGTTKVVTLMGDERVHYMQAEDGTTYQMNESGTFDAVDATLVRSQLKAKARARNAQRRVTWGLSQQDVRGNKKGLVILVNFSDKTIVSTQSEFNNFFNQVGYSKNNMGGSVRDYFLSQSYGQLTIDFDVVGPVTVSKSYSYYGANDSNGSDKYPATMVIEALKLADSQVNFADYDWDGDGEVDQVYVIYAGYGEASGAPANTIWPHEYELSSANYYGDGGGAQKLDGVKIDTYACSSELYGTSGSKVDGVGTACHEFSHCLGIPDMYDTEGSNFGMDSWDLMDYGCYGGDGYWPCGYTSYERIYSGWMKPTVLSSYKEVKDMPALVNDSAAYIIYNQKDKDEYYLLENRQQTGWDKYLPGHGMLVLHVDFDKTTWVNNTVNNTSSHQRMTIIPADNSKSNTTTSQLAGDPFPGTKGKTELTNTSTPAATLYNANSDGTKYMNYPIRSISENTLTKTVSFVGGDYVMDTPVATDATRITWTSFNANWQTTNGAESYEVVLTDHDPNGADKTIGTLLEEDFSGFNNGNSNDGTSDISSSLDTYTKTAGWTGKKVYTSPYNYAKLGSSQSTGTLTTPTLSASGQVDIKLACKKWTNPLNTSSTADATVNVSVNGVQIGSVTPTTTESTTTLTATVNGEFTVSIEPTARVYISGLTISGAANADTYTTITTTGTSYPFSGLDSTHEYSYVVYGLAGSYKSDASNSISVTLTDPSVGITSVGEDAHDGQIFDLSGRRVSKATKGIYIVDGKKIVK